MASSVNRSWVGESTIKRNGICLLPLLMAVVVLSSGAPRLASAVLAKDYYGFGCAELESIVRSGVQQAYYSDNRIVASILRLFFHDCIVDGCDASNLLVNTGSFTGEQSSTANINSARGYNVIDDIKASVEAVCPGIVSCADILALAARDSVGIAGGPYWYVQLGRLDSKTASLTDADNDIPAPFFNFDSLVSSFARAGLDVQDLVTLSGAHTFGKAQCSSVNVAGNSRLYDWSENSDLTSGTGEPDPNMDPGFLASLQRTCPQGGDGTVLNNLDLSTPMTFDNWYYKNLLAKKGLLNSDQALFYQNSYSQSLVYQYAANQFEWFDAFVNSITKMGSIESSFEGEIRAQCGYPNPGS